LQDKELVERSPHIEDRRRLPLKLSRAKGISLFRKVVPKALAYEQQLLEVLSADELNRLNRLIQKLQASAENVNKN
jgi:DNA-binding MarR family transcriptional regulator